MEKQQLVKAAQSNRRSKQANDLLLSVKVFKRGMLL